MILAVDTSTELTSVALTDGDAVIGELSHLDARKHAEVLAPMARDLLAGTAVSANEVHAIAVGVGPGPYTGLRVGIATARAFGSAWGVPVHGLCSLDAIAVCERSTGGTAAFGVASDARRREVYWAWYDAVGVRVEGPLVSRPSDIRTDYRLGRWLGGGARLHRAEFGDVDEGAGEALLYPHASWVGRGVDELLVAGVAQADTDAGLSDHSGDGGETSSALLGTRLLSARPLYLRRPDAAPSA
jgi:tRNA threonylcarbamoyl adenosine modification protein YeaZ